MKGVLLIWIIIIVIAIIQLNHGCKSRNVNQEDGNQNTPQQTEDIIPSSSEPVNNYPRINRPRYILGYAQSSRHRLRLWAPS